MKKLILLVSILTLILSCEKNMTTSIPIEITGTIQKQGITSYMYGTHFISGYALRSNSILLDNYINYNVTIVGYKIDGYPVDGGPEYIEVTDIICGTMNN
tara:strand:+ start:192 stop:491 length:300 start_codon:yes stop_codon:yes gene_type:complete